MAETIYKSQGESNSIHDFLTREFLHYILYLIGRASGRDLRIGIKVEECKREDYTCRLRSVYLISHIDILL